MNKDQEDKASDNFINNSTNDSGVKETCNTCKILARLFHHFLVLSKENYQNS